MYLRKVAYQLGVRVKSLLPRFHKSDLQNLALSLVKIPIFSKLGSLHKRTRLNPGSVESSRIELLTSIPAPMSSIRQVPSLSPPSGALRRIGAIADEVRPCHFGR